MSNLAYKSIYELFDVSEIYKTIYPIIRQHPNLLRIEVLSRLKHKSAYTKAFSLSSGLNLISSYIKNDDFRDLFVIDWNSEIIRFHSEYNGKHIFVETHTNLETEEDDDEDIPDALTQLYIIDSLNGRFKKSLEFKFKPCNLQILLMDKRILNESIDGLVYFSKGNIVFKMTFYGNVSPVKMFDTEIKHLLLLNPTYLLVVFVNSMVLVQINSVNEPVIKQVLNEVEEINIIESNIPVETVFTSKYLYSVGNKIVLIVGLAKSKALKVYKFENESISLIQEICPINLISFKFHDEDQIWKYTLTIDESFMINNLKLNNKNSDCIRFALKNEIYKKHESKNELNIREEEKETFETLIQVFAVNPSNFNILARIYESDLGIDETDKYDDISYYGNVYKEQLNIEGFMNNKLVLKLKTGYSQWNLYIYNIETKIFSIVTVDAIKVNAFQSEGLLIAQKSRNLEIYDTNTFKMLSSFNHLEKQRYDNHNKNDFKMKNDKLLRLEPNWKKSIKVIDFKKRIEVDNSCDIKLDWMHDIKFLDHQHILILLEKQDIFETTFAMAIVNIEKYCITATLKIPIPAILVRIMGTNLKYIVLSRNYMYIDIYKINRTQDAFVFERIHMIDLQCCNKEFERFNKCWFDDADDNKLTITLYNSQNSCIEVRFIENNNDANQLNETIINLNINVELLDDEARFLLTSLKNYLVFYTSNTNVINYLNLINYQIKHSVEMDSIIFFVECLTFTNNLIVKCLGGSLYYLYFDLNDTLQKIKLKDEQIEEYSLKIENDYLVIIMANGIEIYKLDALRQENKLSNSRKVHHLLRAIDASPSISINSKYLTIETESSELCVYNMENMKLIGYLELNDQIFKLFSNERYIALRLLKLSNLILFKIVD